MNVIFWVPNFKAKEIIESTVFSLIAFLGAFIDNTGTPDSFDNFSTYSSSQKSKLFLLRTNSIQSYPDCFANSKILCKF